MQSFFNLILRPRWIGHRVLLTISGQKKMLFSVLLFLALFGILLPKDASAFSFDASNYKCEKSANANSMRSFVINSLTGGITSGVTDAIVGSLSPNQTQITYTAPSVSDPYCFIEYGLVLGASWLGVAFTKTGETFINVASAIFRVVLSELIKDYGDRWVITKNIGFAGPVFYNSWLIVKEWANMLVVLGFIGIALSFILNLEQYKKLLIPLLITALLINFSIVLVGLMIDASNVVMKSLLGSGDATANLNYQINKAWNDSLYKFPVSSMSNAVAYFGLSIIFSLAYFGVGITLLLFASIFIIRYVMLAILFILSPLALVLRIFPIPSAKKLWDDWWQNIIKWSFIGLGGAFFLSLATQITLKANEFIITGLSAGSSIGQDKIVSSTLAQLFFYLLIIIIFLLVGIRLTLKSHVLVGIVLGAVAAIVSAIVTGGTSLMGTVGGAALKMGGKATGTSGGLTNIKNKVADPLRNLYHGTREKLGLADAGTLATAKQARMQERLKEPTERLKNLDSKTLAKDINSGTLAERTARINILKERGDISEIGKISPQKAGESKVAYDNRVAPEREKAAADLKTAMDNAMAHDNKLKFSDFVKSDYRYAGIEHADNKTLEKNKKIIKNANPTYDDKKVLLKAQKLTIQEQIAQNLPNMSDSQRMNIDKEYLDNSFIIEHFNPSVARSYKSADRHIRARIRNARNEIKTHIKEVEKGGSKEDPAEFNRLRNLLKAINKIPEAI